MSTKHTEAHHQPGQPSAREEKPSLTQIVRVLVPSLILILFAVASPLSAASGRVIRPGKRTASLLLRLLAIFGAVFPWAYAFVIRPRHLRWGATDEELSKPLLGDKLVPDPSCATASPQTRVGRVLLVRALSCPRWIASSPTPAFLVCVHVSILLPDCTVFLRG